VAIDRELEAGVATHCNQAQAVSFSLIDADNSKRGL